MKQHILLYLTLCCVVPAFSQEPRFSVDLYQGISRAIANSNSPKYSIGHSWAIGTSARFQKRNSTVFFQPAAQFAKYGLRTRLSESLVLKVAMRCLNLMPMAGLQVNSRLSVSSGLLFQISHAGAEAVFRQNSTYRHYSNNHLYENLEPNRFQAGPVLQFSARAGENGKLSVYLLLQYIASPLLRSDYTITIAGSAAKDQLVITHRSRAISMLGGIGFRIAGKTKN